MVQVDAPRVDAESKNMRALAEMLRAARDEGKGWPEIKAMAEMLLERPLSYGWCALLMKNVW